VIDLHPALAARIRPHADVRPGRIGKTDLGLVLNQSRPASREIDAKGKEIPKSSNKRVREQKPKDLRKMVGEDIEE
jgi:hypothetical protein